jgi:putative ABC transport system permease protein
MMIHPGFIRREIARSSKQAVVFILCVGLSLVTLTAFGGFSKSIHQSLLHDARKLHAADIVIRSYETLSEPLSQALSENVQEGRVVLARYHEFYSVIRTNDDSTSVLSQLKVVEKGYPFYGEVLLQSGRPLHEVLTSGQTVVAPTLLDRLGLRLGDTIQVGYTSLTIQDVVLAEPDRPISLFSFGPRVFIAAEDLDALGLIQTGSRIRHVHLLKVKDGKQTDALAHRLGQIADLEREQVDTFQTARSRIKRFFERFIFFLNLVGIFILVVSGVGIQSTLTALLNEKQYTIAIMKALGASNRHILVHYMIIVMLLGSIGVGAGILIGILIQYGLAHLLSAFLPPGTPFLIAWSGMVESVVLGLLVALIFFFVPLYRLRDMHPVMVLRKDVPVLTRQWPVVACYGIFALFFFGLVFRHMQDVRFGLYFVAGIGGLIMITTIVTYGMLRVLRHKHIQSLALRQAVKGLFRKGGATQTIMVSLTTALCVIFSIYLVEQNLDATFVKSFPPDSPNLFFLDIQPDQTAAFSKAMNKDVLFYPIVRARVTHVNSAAIDRKAERSKKRDNLARVFNLTYRDHLLDDEVILQGGKLFNGDWQGIQVSVLDTVIDMHPMDIGDTIQFNIQGVPLTARLASIRSRTKGSLRPFFYFVFERETLKSAPQTLFSALRVAPENIGPLQTRVVKQFPNINVIDVSETIRVFAGIMKQLSEIVRGFSVLSILAGVLILISSVFATRAERITESVYYKILGARTSFVIKVFSLENLLMGLASSVLAVIISQVGTYMICRFVLEIDFRMFWLSCILMVVGAVMLVNGVGILSARSILKKKPITYLREQPDA